MEEQTTIQKQSPYDYIKHRILTCDIMPGLAISEREIMDTLSVGRTPVREALIILQNENLVETFPRKGTIAKPISLQSTLELFDLRKMLEPLACIQHLHQIDLIQLLEHDRKLREVCSITSEESLPSFYTEDIAFHEYLISCSHNEKLIAVCRPLFQEGLRLGMYGAKTKHSRSREETYEQHHQIVQAILNEDAQAIRNAFMNHLNASQISALASLQNQTV